MIIGEVIPDGIYYDMPNDRYRAAFGVSQTELKDIAFHSVNFYKAKCDRGEDPEKSELLIFGSLFDQTLFGFKPEYHVRPEGMDYRSKEGKKWKDDHQDKPILTFEEDSILKAMVESFKLDKFAAKILEASKKEVSIFHTDAETGEKLKIRVDLLPPDSWNFVADAKTNGLSTLHDLDKLFVDKGYYIQASFYLDVLAGAGINKDVFLFLPVSKSYPYAIEPVEIIRGSSEYKVGQAEYRKALRDYSYARKNNDWSKVRQFQLPHWKLKQHQLTDY